MFSWLTLLELESNCLAAWCGDVSELSTTDNLPRTPDKPPAREQASHHQHRQAELSSRSTQRLAHDSHSLTFSWTFAYVQPHNSLADLDTRSLSKNRQVEGIVSHRDGALKRSKSRSGHINNPSGQWNHSNDSQC
jgi:hypothetical protein